MAPDAGGGKHHPCLIENWALHVTFFQINGKNYILEGFLFLGRGGMGGLATLVLATLAEA